VPTNFSPIHTTTIPFSARQYIFSAKINDNTITNSPVNPTGAEQNAAKSVQRVVVEIRTLVGYSQRPENFGGRLSPHAYISAQIETHHSVGGLAFQQILRCFVNLVYNVLVLTWNIAQFEQAGQQSADGLSRAGPGMIKQRRQLCLAHPRVLDITNCLRDDFDSREHGLGIARHAAKRTNILNGSIEAFALHTFIAYRLLATNIFSHLRYPC
jgi:hypothetical protein